MNWDLKTVTVRRTKGGGVHAQDEGKLEAAKAEGFERFDTQTYPDRYEHRLRRPEGYEAEGEDTTDDVFSHSENED